MSFASRQDAGQKLGRLLQNEGVEADVVVGLPRGGVVVAAEVSHLLHLPLETLVVRKIGHPLHREFAVGALAENDIVLLDDKTIGSNEMTRAKLQEVIAEEKERLWQYQLKFHHPRKFDFSGKAVVLVDDGLATGATMEAAVLSAKKQGPRKVVVAVPVASTTAVLKLEHVADSVFVLITDPGFEAVGAYYERFPQTSDDEVLDLLRAEHAHQQGIS
ncbi:MAG TPA: phosphoribosyltransferase family protein [Verrucomicrobiae bacterium]|jgi:predicted phosphoribosyltransferase|nr:phosphoribosyltransferase family protein [Verrucomicrobiae bacterium]